MREALFQITLSERTGETPYYLNFTDQLTSPLLAD
jgi:hypothetical protein